MQGQLDSMRASLARHPHELGTAGDEISDYMCRVFVESPECSILLIAKPGDDIKAAYGFDLSFTVKQSSKWEWTLLSEVHPINLDLNRKFSRKYIVG